MSLPRITLYALRELHLPVLLPVYHALKAKLNCEIGFSSPTFSSGQGDRAEEGLRPETLQRLDAQGISFWGEPHGTQFEAVITADACYDRIEGWGPVICVGHGTISKNIYFIDESSAFRENYATVLCVPGPWYINSFGTNLHTHIEPTGFPKMDDFAKDWDYHRLRILAEAGFDRKKKTIIFAPTYNPEFTGMESFFSEWKKFDPQKIQILFKLHGAADEQWRQNYRLLAKQNPNMFYIEDPSLIPYMSMSDLMVSDVSSAYLEYMVLDKPIVLYNNPRMTETGLYNPKTVEFQIREAAEQIEQAQDLCATVMQALNKDVKGNLRRSFVQQLFPPMDGKICERVADVVAKLLDGRISSLPPFAQSLNIYLPEHIRNYSHVRDNLKKLAFPYQIFSHTHHPELRDFQIHRLARHEEIPLPIVILNGQFQFAHAWDWILALAQKWAPNCGVILPMLSESPGNGIQQLQRLLNQHLQAPQPLLQAYSKYNLIHLSIEIDEGLLDGMVLTTELVDLKCELSQWIQQPDGEEMRRQWIQKVRSRGISVRVLTGFYGF